MEARQQCTSIAVNARNAKAITRRHQATKRFLGQPHSRRESLLSPVSNYHSNNYYSPQISQIDTDSDIEAEAVKSTCVDL